MSNPPHPEAPPAKSKRPVDPYLPFLNDIDAEEEKALFSCVEEIWDSLEPEDPVKPNIANTAEPSSADVRPMRTLGEANAATNNQAAAGVTEAPLNPPPEPKDHLDQILSEIFEPTRTPEPSNLGDSKYVRTLVKGAQKTEANAFCFCGDRFGDESSLKRHQKRAHSIDDNETSQTSAEETEKPICDICLKVFKKMQDKTRHMSICHANDRFKCPECDTPFSSKRAVTFHRQEMHGMIMKKRAKSKVAYNCDLCSYSCKWIGNLKRHVKQAHLKERKHPCNICGMQFGTSNNLRVHLMSCGKRMQALTCEKCGAVFKSVTLLRRHKKTCVVEQRNEFPLVEAPDVNDMLFPGMTFSEFNN